MITITLKGTPTAKARARVGKWGTYTPKKSKNYSDALAWAGKAAMKGKNVLDGALRVEVWCYMPIPKSLKKDNGQPHTKKPDLDNIIKQLDSLNGIVWNDDSQISELYAFKVYHDTPAIQIQVTEL